MRYLHYKYCVGRPRVRLKRPASCSANTPNIVRASKELASMLLACWPLASTTIISRSAAHWQRPIEVSIRRGFSAFRIGIKARRLHEADLG